MPRRFVSGISGWRIETGLSELNIPVYLSDLEDPAIIPEQVIVQKTINYWGMVIAGATGGLLGTIIYITLKLIGLSKAA